MKWLKSEIQPVELYLLEPKAKYEHLNLTDVSQYVEKTLAHFIKKNLEP